LKRQRAPQYQLVGPTRPQRNPTRQHIMALIPATILTGFGFAEARTQ